MQTRKEIIKAWLEANFALTDRENIRAGDELLAKLIALDVPDKPQPTFTPLEVVIKAIGDEADDLHNSYLGADDITGVSEGQLSAILSNIAEKIKEHSS